MSRLGMAVHGRSIKHTTHAYKPNRYSDIFTTKTQPIYHTKYNLLFAGWTHTNSYLHVRHCRFTKMVFTDISVVKITEYFSHDTVDNSISTVKCISDRYNNTRVLCADDPHGRFRWNCMGFLAWCHVVQQRTKDKRYKKRPSRFSI